jgi:hypothetical protein
MLVESQWAPTIVTGSLRASFEAGSKRAMIDVWDQEVCGKAWTVTRFWTSLGALATYDSILARSHSDDSVPVLDR